MYPTYSGTGFYWNYNFGLYGALLTYGTLKLTDSSPIQSFTEPLSLAEVKDYLALPSTISQAQQDTLTALISAAREQAEILQKMDLVRKQWDLSMDYWNSYAIRLRPPLVSVDLVQYKDFNGALTQLTENVDFIADPNKRPGIVTPAYNKTWPTFTPWPSSSILIRYTSGYDASSAYWADAGSRVKVGMRQLIALWFNRRLPFSTAIQQDPVLESLLSYGAVPSVR